MAKQQLLILTAAAVVVLAVFAATTADAYAYETVVTTTSIYNDRWCREEVRRQDLDGCGRYLSNGNRRDLDRCCEELDRVDERCQEEALREAMQSQEEGQSEGRQKQEMMQRAREVRDTCRVCSGGGGRKIRMMY